MNRYFTFLWKALAMAIMVLCGVSCTSAPPASDGTPGNGVHAAPLAENARYAACTSTDVPVTRDTDGDGWGAIETPTCAPANAVPAGKSKRIGDCDDNDNTTFPGAQELVDGWDNNCDTRVDEGRSATITCYVDADNDGEPLINSAFTSSDADCESSGEAYYAETLRGYDCDDTKATVGHDRAEVANNSTDDDCNATTLDGGTGTFYWDGDHDGYGNLSGPTVTVATTGYVSNSSDCNDNLASVNPGATEVCNSIDDNCWLSIDENNVCSTNTTWYRDADNDSYGNASVFVSQASQPSGYVANSNDCNDAAPLVHPGAVEVCNTIDDNCVLGIDEANVCSTGTYTFYKDADVDGYGNLSVPTTVNTNAPPTGYVANSSDCNDALATVHPGAAEVTADEIDQDCNGAEICYLDSDDDGYRSSSGQTLGSGDVDCADPFEAKASDPATDCDDVHILIHPGATELVGDEVDQDCNGTELCYLDSDDDGYRPTSGTAQVMSADTDCADPYEAKASDLVTDCDDAHVSAHPGGAEVCGNGVDEDCVSGDASCAATCYVDADDDGYRTSVTTTGNGDGDCNDANEATSSDGIDCNDSSASVHPGASEVQNDGIDQDCDGNDSTTSSTCPTDESMFVAKFTAPSGSVIDATHIYGWELGQTPEIGTLPNPVTQFKTATPSGVTVTTSVGNGSTTANVVTVAYSQCVPDGNQWQMSVGYYPTSTSTTLTYDCVGHSNVFTGSWLVTSDGAAVPVTPQTNWSGNGCEAAWDGN